MNIIRTIGLALVLFATVEPLRPLRALAMGPSRINVMKFVSTKHIFWHGQGARRFQDASYGTFAHCLISVAATTPRQLRSR